MRTSIDVIMDRELITNIQKTRDFIGFMRLLSDVEEGAIIISVKDIIGEFLLSDGVELLNEIGCKKINLSKKGHRPYIFIKKDGVVVYEEIGELYDSLQINTELYKRQIDVLSGPLCSGNTASITVDGLEYAVNRRGLNIVVLSDEGSIVDSVSVDIHNKKRPLGRLYQDRVVKINGRSINHLVNRKTGEIRERLKLENIFSDVQYLNKNKDALKVRFFIFGKLCLWNACETVVKAFMSDRKFDVLIVLEVAHGDYIAKLRKEGICFVLSKDYQYQEDRPDIAIFNSAALFCVEWMRRLKDTKYKAIISAFLINGVYDSDVNKHFCQDWLFDGLIDDYIISEHVYKRITKETDLFKSFTNPKFDVIFREINKTNKIPNDWTKLKGKKIILWAFDHGWTLNDCAFDQYIKPFIQYIERSRDLAMILRPHISLIDELKSAKIWSDADYYILKKYFRDSSNMIWDESDDYGMAYSLADAVITDVNCGITLSAIVLDVPIAITHRFDGGYCNSQYPEINECHYHINNPDDAFSFFNMIIKGEDPKKEERNRIKEEYITSFDGKNGERIKNYIVKRYEEKMRPSSGKLQRLLGSMK